MELLERIKHLFNIENVIFVVSLDKQQLRTSLGAVYGQGINADEYLRRFIDLEFLLPKPDAEAFTKSLFERFGFDSFFEKRTVGDLRYDKENFLQPFTKLSDRFGISLRAREQVFTWTRVAMMTTPDNYFLHPHLLVMLTFLKIVAPTIYHDYALGDGKAKDVIEYLKNKMGGFQMLDSHFIMVTAGYLIAAKADKSEKLKDELQEFIAITQDESHGAHKQERAQYLIDTVNSIRKDRQSPSLAYVVNKLELAAQFK